MRLGVGGNRSGDYVEETIKMLRRGRRDASTGSLGVWEVADAVSSLSHVHLQHVALATAIYLAVLVPTLLKIQLGKKGYSIRIRDIALHVVAHDDVIKLGPQRDCAPSPLIIS